MSYGDHWSEPARCGRCGQERGTHDDGFCRKRIDLTMSMLYNCDMTNTAKCWKCGKLRPLSEVSHRILKGPNKKVVIYYRQCDACRQAVLSLRDAHRVPAAMRALVFAAHGKKCLACRVRPGHIDHVIPISRGGLTTVENLQVLCHSCNSTKGMSSKDFRKGAK